MKNKNIMKDKKGDISITLLVLGVFAVCSLALFSFYISGINGKETAIRVGIVEKIKSLEGEIRFYQSPEINKNPMEIMELFDKGITEGNLIFIGVKDGDKYIITGTYFEYDLELFGFGIGEKKTIFSVEYSFVP
ncbi:hypothetical protein HYT25_03955 [Candidatus Pacearchaeota archaeon]|nr:hypothetical protein [Candidatus Pacearchaeota archaeon]